MKGIIFNLLEEAIVQSYGEDKWDELLAAAEVEGAYTAVGNYPDEDIRALIAAAEPVLGTESSAFQRWFGKEAVPRLITKYPAFFAAHRSTRDFLLGMPGHVYPEMRKVYSGSSTPAMRFREAADGGMLMEYWSSLRLCLVMEGVMVGVARHFGDALEMLHVRCVERGDARCIWHLALCREPSGR